MGVAADVDEIKRADIAYQIAQNYYDGKGVKEVFSNPATAAVLGKAAASYMVNIAKRGVDAVTDKLVVTGWKITRDGDADADYEDEFRVNVWDHNTLKQLIPDAITAAEVQGDSYLVAWPDEDDESTAVDVFFHKALGARLFYDDENERVKRAYVRTWLVRGQGSTNDQTTWFRRVNEITADTVRKLITSVPAAAAKDDSHYIPFTGDDPEDPGADSLPSGISVNPFGEVTVWHLRTERPYGVPEHYCLYGCQNLLLKIVCTLGESVDGFGIPWRYRTMSSDKTLKPGGDQFAEDADDDPDDQERLRIRAGELSNLWDTDSVGQLMPADVDNLLNPIDKVFDIAATLSTTPIDYFHASAAAASGESKKEHKGPYHAKVQRRLTDFGDELVACLEFVAQRMLELDDATVVLLWKPFNELTDSERYAQVKEAIDAGVPWRQAMLEAGYEAEQVDEWIALGFDPDNSPDARAKRFRDLAAGTRDMAAAVQLGNLDTATVMTVLQQAAAPREIETAT